jgi:hypothetical protein
MKEMVWTGHVACMGQMRNAYTILVGKPEGKRPFRRPRSRWEVNISTDLREIGWEIVDWVNMVQDMNKWRVLVNTLMKLRVP